MADARLRGRRTPLVLSVKPQSRLSRKLTGRSPRRAPFLHPALLQASSRCRAAARLRRYRSRRFVFWRSLAHSLAHGIAHRATLSGIGIGGDLVIAADQSRLLPATSSAVRFEPCSRLGCRTVTSSCSRFSFSPFSYGAVEILFWPSLHLVVGIPLWFGWEYARPTWTTGLITGTEVRRSDPDARGNTTASNTSTCVAGPTGGLELTNEDSWWWLKRNSERVFNDAKTAQSRNTEMTVMWNRWRSTLFTWYPNAITIGSAGSWPL